MCITRYPKKDYMHNLLLKKLYVKIIIKSYASNLCIYILKMKGCVTKSFLK
jgi:hypothetical protein